MPDLERPTARVARRFAVYGTVQGVGFRPFVYRLAVALGVDGSVRNDDGHVVVEAAGPPTALTALARRLRTEAPVRARVTRIETSALPRVPAPGFTVEASTPASGHPPARDVPPTSGRPSVRDFPPDIATCDDCLRELFDPADRRYRYPFVNCTNCGPRATIIDDLPYDRSRTSMAAFPLCPACAAEYADPGDRRFHAEPVACPACGPRLSWSGGGTGEDALRAAESLIAAGGIAAIKGLGGYQLICDATNEQAVRRLRERKHRATKPLAVMAPTLAAAEHLVHLSPTERTLLTSPAAPIVLSTARGPSPSRPSTPAAAHDPSPDGPVASARARRPYLAASVHPGTRQLGVFLPYTPLHHLLLRDLARPLVVTSGNRSDEPIVTDDAAALDRLGAIADGFLRHDRAIRARYDDSVTRAAGRRPSIVRRARGYAPEPLRLPVPAPRPLLAAGAELKHTFTLAQAGRALVGPHTGDLEDADTLDAFRHNLAHLSRLQAIEPEIIAHDLHPGYLSTQYAKTWPADRRLAVQHHHAHVASCAAEHGLTGRFIGVAYDGLGLGDDGTLWGGEVLIADLAGYRRFARFATAPLPGGAAAVRRPARMALGYLFGAEPLGAAAPPAADAFLDRLPEPEVRTVRRMVERRVNAPLASSAGRLFDAVASLLGLCDDASYEGEAAVRLEAAAAPRPYGELPWRLVHHDGLLVYDPRPTLRAVLTGGPPSRLAARFHATIVAVTAALVAEAARETGLRDVCLSGGVFQNRLLTRAVTGALRRDGLIPYVNRDVPVNDGGISYGQAAIAARLLRGR